MNRWTKGTGLAVGLVGPGTVAAAEGAARQDTSGVFVWAFLGLCALIVVAQLVPAILMAVGAARGVAQGLRSAKGRKVEAR